MLRRDARILDATIAAAILKNFRFNLFPEAGASVTSDSAEPGKDQEEQYIGC